MYYSYLLEIIFFQTEFVFTFFGFLLFLFQVKDMAAYNWQVYSMETNDGTFPVTPGQLLAYPLNVMPDGSIEYLPDMSSFPDFPSSAKVMGKTHWGLPEKLTT